MIKNEMRPAGPFPGKAGQSTADPEDNQARPENNQAMQAAKSIPLTIAIPTYNRAEKVAALASSIAAQLGPGDELLVVDDCSPDKTTELLGAMSGVRLERHSANQGMVKNWNSCFEMAANDWICIIHDDDVVSENAVSILRNTYTTIGKPALIGQPWHRSPPPSSYHYHVYAPGSSAVLASALCPSGAVIHRALYEDMGGFDERFAYSADMEYFARLAARHDLVIIAAPAVVIYQFHEDNYQYETWMKPDFWPQWEEIAQCIFSYARLDESAFSGAYKEHMAAALRYIMETAVKRKDKALLRKYAKISLSSPEYGRRIQLKGLIAATLGR